MPIPLIEAAARADFLRGRHRGKSIPAEAYDKLESADPTPNKEYLQWMIRMFSRKLLKEEDIYKLEGDLKAFHKHKRRLPAASRDINRIKSPRDLYELVRPLLGAGTGRELRREERRKLDKDIKVLYDGPKGKLYVPMTEKASCFLGRGTRWCTAADKHNAFMEYSSKGPLYVLINRKGEKFQIHVPSGSIMDDEDDHVTAGLRRRRVGPILDEWLATVDEQDWLAALDGTADNSDWETVAVYNLLADSLPEGKHPPERIMAGAASLDPYILEEIARQMKGDPPESVQLVAVAELPSVVEWIQNPSEAVQLAIVKSSPDGIIYFNSQTLARLSETVQMAAVKHRKGGAMVFVMIAGNYAGRVSAKLQRAAAEHPKSARYLRDLRDGSYGIEVLAGALTDPKAQAGFVRMVPYIYKHLDNPSDEATEIYDKLMEDTRGRRDGS